MDREEDNLIQLFSIKAWISVRGFLSHHWNMADFNKLEVKFTHLVDVDEDALSKSDTQAAKLLVECEDASAIPTEFNVTLGNQLSKIQISVV